MKFGRSTLANDYNNDVTWFQNTNLGEKLYLLKWKMPATALVTTIQSDSCLKKKLWKLLTFKNAKIPAKTFATTIQSDENTRVTDYDDGVTWFRFGTVRIPPSPTTLGWMSDSPSSPLTWRSSSATSSASVALWPPATVSIAVERRRCDFPSISVRYLRYGLPLIIF